MIFSPAATEMQLQYAVCLTETHSPVNVGWG